ncbi:MAG: NFACT family protein [Thermaerobacter sp.]
MSVDGLLLRACLEEVRSRALGARVERVYQPRPDTLTISLYRPGSGPLTLLARCSARHGRLHLTSRRLDNPPSPTDFCMVLRKHLEGRRLVEARQRGLDRLAALEFGGTAAPPVRLVLELTGPAANAVLVDAEDRVLDAMKRRAGAAGGRDLVPHAVYEPPARGDRLELTALDVHKLAVRLDGSGGGPLWRLLLAQVEGPGPDVWREMAMRAGCDPDQAWHEVPPGARRHLFGGIEALAATARAGAWSPAAVVVGSRFRALAAVPLEALARRLQGNLAIFDRPSELCDAVFAAWEEEDALRDRRQALEAAARRALSRAQRRHEARLADLAAAGEAERLRRWGQLLLAQAHLVPRGSSSVTLPDLFEEGTPAVEIPLDPTLTAAANAERLFERARRAERARETAARMLEEAAQEVRHLQAVLVAVEQADDLATLEEVAAELRDHGYLAGAPDASGHRARRRGARGSGSRPGAGGREARSRRRDGGRSGEQGPRPLRLVSRDGWTILVGRSNRQNDHLTFRTAAPTDWWFHVKDEPGAHVIARPPGGRSSDRVPPATLEDAAMAAAYYSAARHGQNVPVDYTQRRRVHKPQGARPGFVVYEGHRTVFVTPDPERLRQLAAGGSGTGDGGAPAGNSGGVSPRPAPE